MNILNIGNRIRKCVEKAQDKIPLDEPDYAKALKDTERDILRLELTKVKRDIEYAKMVRELLEAEGMMEPKRTAHTLPNKWCMITIRPDKTPNIQSFHNALRCGLAKPLFLEYTYAFEQKGETVETMGKGFHVHIVAKVRDGTRTQNIIAALTNKRSPLGRYTFQLQIGNGRSKFIPDETGLTRAMNYIRGDKHNDAKTKACEIDVIWRQAVGLLPVYTEPNQVQGSV